MAKNTPSSQSVSFFQSIFAKMSKIVQARSPLSRAHWAGITTGLFVCVVGFGALVFASFSDRTTILPRVTVGNIAIGNKTPVEAKALLDTAIAPHDKITVKVGDKEKSWSLKDLGIAINTEKTAQTAMALGGADRPIVTTWNRIRLWFAPIRLPAYVAMDDQKLNPELANFAKEASVSEQNAKLEFQAGSWRVVESKDGALVTGDQLRLALVDQLADLGFDPVIVAASKIQPAITTAAATPFLTQAEAITKKTITLKATSETTELEPSLVASWIELSPAANKGGVPTLALNQTSLQGYIKTLADHYNVLPVDARVVFRNGEVSVTQESHTGRTLNEEKAGTDITAAILVSVSEPVTLVFTTANPDVSSSTLATLGLKELIGKSTTSYIGSPDNRKHNIANGVKFLTGKVLKPGDEFSVISSLGTIDKTTGYLPELVIKENQTIPEYGGGLCQVSTTLFRAALSAGLKITERQNHSYRVPYYERGVGPGLDATIYYPEPDLKFANDTPGWILVQGSLLEEKNEITFELYGTKDGRTSIVDGPHILEQSDPPPAQYAETSTLPTGTTKQIDHAHPGAKTSVTYIVTKDGKTLFSQTFKSVYRPWPAKFLVGTGPASEESSPPEATTQTEQPSSSPTESAY